MARSAIPIQALPSYGNGVANLEGVGISSDATNDHTLVNPDGKVICLVINDSAGSVVVTADQLAVPATFGSGTDKSVTVAAGNVGYLGPFPPDAFNQAGGVVHIDPDTSSSSIKLVGLRLA